MRARPLLTAWFVAAATLVALAQQTFVVGGQSSIRGTVRDAQAATAPALVAVVFPIDTAKWTAPDAARTIKRVDVVSGRFAFEDLPAGEYRLAFAIESGLTGWPASSVLERLAKQRTLSIPVAAGEQVGVDAVAIRAGTDVSIQDASVSRLRLVTGDLRTAFEFKPTPIPGAISGRVIDAFGKPVVGVEVRALPWTLGGGVNRGAFSPLVVTDADGRYLIPSQQPGAYLVSVPSFTADRQSLLSTRRVPPAPVDKDGQRRGYVNTYYPDVVDASAAKVVYVTISERGGVDIQLASRVVFDVAGRVVGDLPASPTPPLMTVTYVRGDARTAFGDPRRVKVSPDGTFAIEELPDGEYALDMLLTTGFVQTRVVVAGKALPPLSVLLQPFTLVTGRSEFRGEQPPNPAMRGLFYLSPVTPRDDGVYTSAMQADGTFTAQAVGPGPYRLRASASAPWIQVAGMINGIDTLDLPALLDTNISDAVVLFADHESRLTLEVRNDRGEPVGEVGVLVFSDDQRYWVSSSRRVQLSETSVDGKCLLTDLPPGKYFAVAGRDFRMGRAITPAFVGALKSRAVAFEMGAGQSKVVQLVLK